MAENSELVSALLGYMNVYSKMHKDAGIPLSSDFKAGMKQTLALVRRLEAGLGVPAPKAPSKVLLIDGSSLLTTAYFRNLPADLKNVHDPEELAAKEYLLRHDSKGRPINALEGMLEDILRLIETQNPTHVVIGFDQSREQTFRRQMYAEYKAQRNPTPTPLVAQKAEALAIFKALGIPVVQSPTYEADDLIGSIAKQWSEKFEGAQVYLYTKDRDYLQLIDDDHHVKLWLAQPSEAAIEKVPEAMQEMYQGREVPEGYPREALEIDAAACKARYGIRPDQVADWKGISGDSSDNIPGVYRVGDTAAIPLLGEYGSVEGIYEAMESALAAGNEAGLKEHWKSLGMRQSPIKNLSEHKAEALLSKTLATIKTDIPVPVSLDDAQMDWGQEFEERFMHVCDEYDLRDFVNHARGYWNEAYHTEEYGFIDEELGDDELGDDIEGEMGELEEE